MLLPSSPFRYPLARIRITFKRKDSFERAPGQADAREYMGFTRPPSKHSHSCIHDEERVYMFESPCNSAETNTTSLYIDLAHSTPRSSRGLSTMLRTAALLLCLQFASTCLAAPTSSPSASPTSSVLPSDSTGGVEIPDPENYCKLNAGTKGRYAITAPTGTQVVPDSVCDLPLQESVRKADRQGPRLDPPRTNLIHLRTRLSDRVTSRHRIQRR